VSQYLDIHLKMNLIQNYLIIKQEYFQWLIMQKTVIGHNFLLLLKKQLIWMENTLFLVKYFKDLIHYLK
jgi:hypothetical protein